jgi:alkylation response protein AidB-like acyl-CoA dehydrogenase
MERDPDPRLDEVRRRTHELIESSSPPVQRRAGVRAPEPDEVDALRAWTGALFEAKLIGVEWPVEYGGLADPHPLHEAVVREELARAGVRMPISGGLLAAAAIIAFGTEEQKRFFLPNIRSGSHIWCQLFSEPDAGSDLAGMRAKARHEGERYLVDGQKVWTTNGQYADWGYLLARTDADAPKHQGITAFAVDMRAPGITVRPLREITGTSDFNEVFFDSVEVPVDNVIGPAGGGWKVATASLSNERSGVGGSVVTLQAIERLLSLARHPDGTDRPALERHDVRQAIGGFIADAFVNAALSAHGQSRSLAGTGDAADAPVSKIFFSETNLALTEYGMNLQRGDGIRVEGDALAVEDGWWQDAHLYSRAFTIAGGTNEVLRNVIAERALGLPRG